MVESIDLDKTRGHRTKSSCFACFSPAVDDFDDDNNLSFRSVSTASSDRKSVLRSLSGSFRALFFGKSYVRKSKRHRRDSSTRSNSKTMTSKSKKSSIKPAKSKEKRSMATDEVYSEPEEHFGGTSDNSSLTCTTSISSDSRSASERMAAADDFGQKTTKSKLQRICGYSKRQAAAMCLFLICLAALVFWGKAFAILTCTWVWLFFRPATRARAAAMTRRVTGQHRSWGEGVHTRAISHDHWRQ